MPDFRHEYKIELAPGDIPVLRARLGALLCPDPHAPGGRYTIRSLYFDDWTDRALREKLDGVDKREKFRLRCYNGDASLIHLEKKAKQNGLGYKVQADLTAAEVRALLAGDLGWMPGHPAPLVRELYQKMRARGLAPKTLVDYTREAFVYGPGNVRVTLDSGIRTGLRRTDFLDFDCPTVPAPGPAALLEVKWDAFLPDIVRAAVQLPGHRAGAFSKYAACRSYD